MQMSRWVLTILPKGLFSFAWSPSEYRNATFSSISLSSLPPPPQLSNAGLDRPFGNCLGCLGCFTVSPICSDYMHTERTGRRTGLAARHKCALAPTHPSGSHLVFKASCFAAVSVFTFLNMPGLREKKFYVTVICVFMINRRPSWQLSKATQKGEPDTGLSLSLYIYMHKTPGTKGGIHFNN